MLVRTDFVLKYSPTSWLLATFGFAECNEYQITSTHCLIITHEAYTELKMDISHCSDVYKRHGISNHRQLKLFVQQLV